MRRLALLLGSLFLTACSDGHGGGAAALCACAPAALQEAAALRRALQAVRAPHVTEAYDKVDDNPFVAVADEPLSTFSVDVDTASYSNVRRFVAEGSLPPAGAVRIEELVNYFPYRYAPPKDGEPFGASFEAAACPWQPAHRLVRVGLKGREVPRAQRPAANLVFLIDVSGSMQPENKLPLVKRSLRLLAGELDARDKVAIVVYAGAAGLVLPPTAGGRPEVLAALETLEAGGSTNGGEGIRLAYAKALESFVPGGVNRVVLATDGDFNVGVTNQSELITLVETNAKKGVALTVLGFGMGNYKDSTLEKLADRGNGNYGYVDTLAEARKLLVEQVGGTLVTIAKDVKIQVEFNPAQVSSYRLLGYENRLLAARDFNDDAKDAGEIGAGHTVTAFYEVVPAGSTGAAAGVDPLRYQTARTPSGAAASGELLTVKIRYKQPDGATSRLLAFPLEDRGAAFEQASPDFRFAAAVAAFGMLLRDSPHKGAASYDDVARIAAGAVAEDAGGHRAGFLELLGRTRALPR